MFGAIFSALAVSFQKVSEVTQDVGQRIGLPDWMTNSLAGTFELAGSAFGRSSGSGTQTAEATTPNSPSNGGFFQQVGNFFTGNNHKVEGAQLVGTGEKLGRSAAHHNGTFVHAPLGRFDHNPAEAFQVPNVGMDAAMVQARAAMAGAMSA